jgi:hypothetical protein
MIKALALAFALVASATAAPANADPLPKAMLGDWCAGITEPDGSVAHGRRLPNEDCGDGILTFERRRYRGWEQTCIYRQVSIRQDGSRWIFDISANCAGEGCEWQERMTGWFLRIGSRNAMDVKVTRPGKEICK